MTTQLLINEPPLHVLPTLANSVGFHESLVLQQIHYWLKLPISRQLINGNYWVRYTPELWEHQFPFWDRERLHRIIRTLEKRDLLFSHQLKNSCKTMYYTINYRILNKVISSPKSKLKSSSLSSTYDHGNFDESQEEIV